MKVSAISVQYGKEIAEMVRMAGSQWLKAEGDLELW